ncbi:flavin monoamine oxidase family protein [Aquimarina algiphila]|uniref:FAD-dependent oxidoreductase n=1 Tax=Aquimarina algiphila TaxID=2047982 RepID=A0A554VN74_9FLAO|nr:NAD(P)/FAD-dependent oxidoreductase [Aquimarina algiphila]TSE09797.1 FAD-dependent oxidoreductase [Aquimarina algiphila]
MANNTAKYIIVGAGLSGLTSAYMLDKLGETDFLILESRNRIGGRILTENGVDFGATWFQNHHQNVIDLLNDIQVGKFHQYSKGKSVLVYNTMAPAHYFENDPNSPSAFRIEGGSNAVIASLAMVNKNKIRTSTTISEIKEDDDGVKVVTDNGVFKAEKVIVTIPPRIATRILFSPELPELLVKTMKNTHTWMSNAIKVGMTFKTPFWRHKNFSGTLIGQVGAVTELYDHSDANEKKYSLMGFVNEGLRDVSKEERKTRILDHLQKYLGKEVLEYITYQEKDWSLDRNTSCDSIKSIYMSPRYGDSNFKHFYMNGKVLFSGAETSPVYGGYMDGAIYSGISAAKKIISSF